MRRALLLILQLSCLSWSQARAEPVRASLRQHYSAGNQAYLDGDYQRAVENYRRLVDAGIRSPNLYYNLANAYFRLGRKGLAVLFYERALQLDPGNEAAKFNLRLVRKSLIDKLVMPVGGAVGEPPWHSFVRRFSLDGLTWLFLSLYTLAFLVALWRRLSKRESARRLLFWLNVPLLTLVLLAGLLFAGRLYLHRKVHHAVIIQPVVQLREGPDRHAKVLAEVHEGLKVRLLAESGSFVRVRLSNGVEGFVQEEFLGRI